MENSGPWRGRGLERKKKEEEDPGEEEESG